MHRYAAIAALAIFLSGVWRNVNLRQLKKVKPAPEQPAQPPQPPVVPSVPTIPTQQPRPSGMKDQTGQPAPKVRHYDWNGAMQPLVSKCCRLMA